LQVFTAHVDLQPPVQPGAALAATQQHRHRGADDGLGEERFLFGHGEAV